MHLSVSKLLKLDERVTRFQKSYRQWDYYEPLCQGCTLGTLIPVKTYLQGVSSAKCRGEQCEDDQGHRQLARIITADRRARMQQITQLLNVYAQQRVRGHIMQNHPLTMWYRSHRPTRVSLLTAYHRAQHLAWVREHPQWSVEMWENVAWTVEKGFTLVRRTFVYEYGTNPMKRWICLDSRVLVKLVRFPPKDCLHDLK